jgi:hypothetical protein
MSLWWLLPIAILIVVIWAGWYVGAFIMDRRRSREVATDVERLDVDPHGPTSTPRDQQGSDERASEEQAVEEQAVEEPGSNQQGSDRRAVDQRRPDRRDGEP